tara:strand:- start:8608 stop:9870 length:1263 start_codon:yes stop_codon:yes gene_type:complete
MNWFTNLFTGKIPLTQTERKVVWKLFGSFHANKLGQNNNAYLTEGYESNVDVYSVISKTYEVFNSIPQIVERKTSEGWELEEDTTIHELWEKPNIGKCYTWNDINTQRLVYLLCNGNSYMVGQDGFGSTIQEVDILPSSSVTIKASQDFFMPNVTYDFQLGTQKRTYTTEDLQQIKLFNPSFSTVEESFYGLSLIQVASRVVKTGNDRWDASASLFQNRGAIGFVTDQSNRPMDGPQAQQVQEAFDSRQAGAHNYGKTIVTNKALTYQQMAMSSTDLQMIEHMVTGLRAICNVLGYDSSLFNDPENKTYSNRMEAEKSMYTNVMQPLTELFDAHDNKFIAMNHYPDGSRRIRHDYSKIEALQKDKKTEAEKDKIKMEGVNVILNMPISQEGKAELLKCDYQYTDEQIQMILSNESSIIQN